jgi:hypothetical protein
LSPDFSAFISMSERSKNAMSSSMDNRNISRLSVQSLMQHDCVTCLRDVLMVQYEKFSWFRW